jgi:TRAP-type mannitol/chloroaromatic compound transport system substrate-binding protein
MISRRRLAAAAAAAVAAPHVARADAPRRWRLATSWGRNLPGPGVTAARLARRIAELSDGALAIDLFAAGEIVPALNVFDAVSARTIEMGHTAALFWGGKMPAAPLFTTVPFGLGPAAHAGWLDAEGQGLWDRLYEPFGVKPLLAGNTGPSSAGWFRKPVQALADLAGLRIRVAGLGGEIYHGLGATPLTLSPGETYPALERGAIDAAEFLAPANDLTLGLHRVAPHLAFPGFGKPNGASELLIGLAHWRALSPRLQAIVIAAARAEHDVGLAEAARANAAALRVLIAEGTTLFRLPDDLLGRAQEIATEMLTRIRAQDQLSAAIVDSYRAQAGVEARAWDRLTRL